MPDYQRSKIYKIVTNKNGNNDIYIGSTTSPLIKRFKAHLRTYCDWLDGKGRYMSSFKVLGSAFSSIKLIEKYPCKDKYELLARERYHIENNANCVNILIPGTYRRRDAKCHEPIKWKQRKDWIEKEKKKLDKDIEELAEIRRKFNV